MTSSYLKQIINSLGYHITRFPDATESHLSQLISCCREHCVDTLVDVGAHHGKLAEALCKRHHFSNLLLVEPSCEATSILERKFRNHPSAKIIKSALYSHESTLRLNTYSSSDFNSCLRPSPVGRALFPGSFAEMESTPICATTLDASIFPLLPAGNRALLKIDAQGLDFEILLGGSLTLDCSQVITLEAAFIPIYDNQATFSRIDDYLVDKGYRLSSLTPVTRNHDRALIEANAIYVKSQI